jgi:hypothetical protein
MANFYTDNPDLRHHLTHPMMRKIVALKERDYSQAQQYDYAPVDYDDAIDNYDRVLQIVGDLCGNIIADNAVLYPVVHVKTVSASWDDPSTAPNGEALDGFKGIGTTSMSFRGVATVKA